MTTLGLPSAAPPLMDLADRTEAGVAARLAAVGEGLCRAPDPDGPAGICAQEQPCPQHPTAPPQDAQNGPGRPHPSTGAPAQVVEAAGWDREVIAGIRTILSGIGRAHLDALLADRDRLAQWLRNGRDARTRLRKSLEQTAAEAERIRSVESALAAELAETGDRYEAALAEANRHARAELERLRREVDSCVWIDPRRMSGQPCIGGTRILADTIAGLADEGIASAVAFARRYVAADQHHQQEES